MQPLVSAFIDGELEPATASRVNAHLADCLDCCRYLNELVAVELALLDSQVIAPEMPGEISRQSGTLDERRVVPRSLPLNSPKPVMPVKSSKPIEMAERGRSLMRWVPVAAAASVLAGLGMIAMTPGTELTAEEFVEPAAEVQLMHRQRELNQELLVNTLDFDLRALRRELSLLGTDNPNEDEQKQKIAESLEQLIQKVNRLKTPSKNTFE